MTQPYMLAFVGQNANGILRWWTGKVLDRCLERGLAHTLIDLTESGWHEKLNFCLATGRPQFCFSFQGMGMDMHLANGENFWTSNQIPFVSYLGDNPYHAPPLHAAEGPGLYFLYGCEDFLRTYHDFFHGRAYATTIQLGYPENPWASHTPWKERAHSIVFVKTGVDSAALAATWDGYPRLVRSLLHDSAALVLSGAGETIPGLCAQVFKERQIHWGDRREFFLSTCSLVDRYVRAVWAERMVRALMPHDALIVGEWAHLEWAGARARLHAPVPAGELDALYADTRVLINTAAGSRYGVHERVAAGLLAKAAVISDSSPYAQTLLCDCPSYFGVDLAETTLSAQLDHALHCCLAGPGISTAIEESYGQARTIFSFDTFLQTLFDCVALEGYRRTIEAWAAPSRPMPCIQPRPN